ncbi:hypothetical protein [Agromyces sp. GXS1127]|uniref:hypothetical protein n=1 Tax=Agromyces sp. GXS1127 TaxID=3424181 RepID=UPI003D31314D
MSEREAAAERIARGPTPADLVSRREHALRNDDAAPTAGPDDPLRLCIFATVALLGWALGPVALIVFAAVGFAAYWRAWRAGLTRSRCWLRDTRLVLLYLGVLAAAGVAGAVVWATALAARL